LVQRGQNENILYVSKYRSAVVIGNCLDVRIAIRRGVGRASPLKNIPVPKSANLNQFLRALPDGFIDPLPEPPPLRWQAFSGTRK
jgi:hypothetical protein